MLALGCVALVYRRALILAYVASGDFPLRYYLVRNEAGVPALEAGIRYEALHYQRLFATETYDAWLPRLLDWQQTVWLMYWSNDESAFNWLEELDLKRSARYVHRHDGGARHRPGQYRRRAGWLCVLRNERKQMGEARDFQRAAATA